MVERGAIRITVVYSPQPRVVEERNLALAPGSTLVQAVQASGLLQQFPQIDARASGLGPSYGLWGRRSVPGHVLRDGDRVEIYRPLQVDPKLARRERFKKQGVRGTGLFAKRREGAKPGY